jgi:CubicO group peptidase (beta-lactamase class C family)
VLVGWVEFVKDITKRKNMRIIRFYVFVLALLSFVIGSGWADSSPPVHFDLLEAVDTDAQYTPKAHWQKAVRPEIMGWSSHKLEEAKEYSKTIGTSSIVIVQRGVVVDAWGDLGKRITVQSIRKPILGALIGIEVDAGRLNLDSTLADHGIYDVDPPLSENERRATLRDLLLSRSGVYHFAAYETSQMRKNRPARESYPPGAKFYYNNWDFNALGTIYERATGTGIFTAFEEKLAIPLGLEHFRKKDGRYVRGQNSIHAAYPFSLTAPDLARFGLLYLRKGVWNGRTIVSREWVRSSVALVPIANGEKPTKGFAYLWWVRPKSYAGVGSGGQRITVFPDKRLVVAHLAERRKGHERTSGSQARKLAYMIYEAAPK